MILFLCIFFRLLVNSLKSTNNDTLIDSNSILFLHLLIFPQCCRHHHHRGCCVTSSIHLFHLPHHTFNFILSCTLAFKFLATFFLFCVLISLMHFHPVYINLRFTLFFNFTIKNRSLRRKKG